MAKRCPKGVICFEYVSLLVLTILCGIIFIIYTINKQQYYLEHKHHNSSNHLDIVHQHPHQHHSHFPSSVILRHPQRDTLENPYAPPLRYNEPHTYKQIGYLKSDVHGNKHFPIFAKPIHLRRDKWYYYTIFDNIKLPIYKDGRKCSSEHGCDSLYNGDMIQLENMNDNFMVTTYDNNTLVYDPVI